MKKTFKKLNNVFLDLEVCKGVMESKLSDHVDFDFSVEYLPGDGFCILNEDNTNVAPLDTCIKLIKDNNIITVDLHTANSI